jgi:regulator of RNase E activity RraA
LAQWEVFPPRVRVTVTFGALRLHADKHGVLRVPEEIAADIPRAAGQVAEREQRLIAHCKSPDFSLETLKRLYEA